MEVDEVVLRDSSTFVGDSRPGKHFYYAMPMYERLLVRWCTLICSGPCIGRACAVRKRFFSAIYVSRTTRFVAEDLHSSNGNASLIVARHALK